MVALQPPGPISIGTQPSFLLTKKKKLPMVDLTFFVAINFPNLSLNMVLEPKKKLLVVGSQAYCTKN